MMRRMALKAPTLATMTAIVAAHDTVQFMAGATMAHLADCFNQLHLYSKIKYYHRKPKYLILEWFMSPEIKNMTLVTTNIYVLVF